MNEPEGGREGEARGGQRELGTAGRRRPMGEREKAAPFLLPWGGPSPRSFCSARACSREFRSLCAASPERAIAAPAPRRKRRDGKKKPTLALRPLNHPPLSPSSGPPPVRQAHHLARRPGQPRPPRPGRPVRPRPRPPGPGRAVRHVRPGRGRLRRPFRARRPGGARLQPARLRHAVQAVAVHLPALLPVQDEGGGGKELRRGGKEAKRRAGGSGVGVGGGGAAPSPLSLSLSLPITASLLPPFARSTASPSACACCAPATPWTP